MTKITLSLSCLLLLFASCREKQPAFNVQVDAVFSKYNTSRSPGAAIAVIENNAVVYKHGYGIGNLEYEIPITSSTVFDIASVSKQFAGLAISTLVEQGKISLDDDIHKYLPDVPDFGKKITVRHLLNHT